HGRALPPFPNTRTGPEGRRGARWTANQSRSIPHLAPPPASPRERPPRSPSPGRSFLAYSSPPRRKAQTRSSPPSLRTDFVESQEVVAVEIPSSPEVIEGRGSDVKKLRTHLHVVDGHVLILHESHAPVRMVGQNG